jgi:type I restriction-modification system DNA methylase subunit
MSKSLDRVKKFGEVFTPRELVLKMLKQLPQEVFTDPTKTFADITGCGEGAFLVPIVSIKIKCGSTPEQALSTIYGLDIQLDNVEKCKENLLSIAEKASGMNRTSEWKSIVDRNIKCADSLQIDFDKIFE